MHKSLYEPVSNPTCVLYQQFGVEYSKNHLKIWVLNSTQADVDKPETTIKVFIISNKFYSSY